MERNPNITYFAVNQHGDLKTNSPDEGPNAVTWGVFPGKEIVQPTIVETVSFVAWRDEFYRLGSDWSRCYDATSPSRYVIDDLMQNWYLVNIVNNDFREQRGIFPLFENLEVPDLDKEITAPEVPQKINGATNGEKHEEEPKIGNGDVTDSKIPDSVHKKLETQINGAEEKADTEPNDAASHNTGAGPSTSV